MANIAGVLRQEIQRLARKEIRTQTDLLRKDNARLKRDVAALKRSVVALERDAKRLVPQVAQLRQKTVKANVEEAQTAKLGPKLIAALRRRLKLTRNEFAKLVGVSPNSVYLWEIGQISPRVEARASIVALRGIGVREARARLEETA